MRENICKNAHPSSAFLRRDSDGLNVQILQSVMTDEQKFVRELLTRMMEVSGTDPTGLARMAGLSPSTITRFFNSDTKHTLTTTTLFKLSRATGVSIGVNVPAATPGNLSRSAKVDAVLAVARSLEVSVEELIVASASSGEAGRRIRDWLEIARLFPSIAENNAIEALRGVIEATRSQQQDPEPRETSDVRRES